MTAALDANAIAEDVKRSRAGMVTLEYAILVAIHHIYGRMINMFAMSALFTVNRNEARTLGDDIDTDA